MSSGSVVIPGGSSPDVEWRIAPTSETFPSARREQVDPSVDVLELPGLSNRRYLCGLAASPRAVTAALRLRFEVFNVELGEGLPESWQTGLDQDPFDEHMEHLVLICRRTGEVVGTYRMQTPAAAAKGGGYYCATEYDISGLEPILPEALEIGRACLGKQHRNPVALLSLWQGLRVFMQRNELDWLFGLCSLHSTDWRDGWRAYRTIKEGGFFHPTLRARPLPDFVCGDPDSPEARDPEPGLALPSLFRPYHKLGARVVSIPARDVEFNTVNFVVVINEAQTARTESGRRNRQESGRRNRQEKAR